MASTQDDKKEQQEQEEFSDFEKEWFDSGLQEEESTQPAFEEAVPEAIEVETSARRRSLFPPLSKELLTPVEGETAEENSLLSTEDFQDVLTILSGEIEPEKDEQRESYLLRQRGLLKQLCLDDGAGAQDDFVEAISKHQGDKVNLKVCLNLYLQRKKWKKALETLDFLINLEKKSPDISYKMRLLLLKTLLQTFKLSQPKEAIATLQGALELSPTSRMLRLLYQYLLYWIGQKTELNKFYQGLLTQEQDLEQREKGSILLAQGFLWQGEENTTSFNLFQQCYSALPDGELLLQKLQEGKFANLEWQGMVDLYLQEGEISSDQLGAEYYFAALICQEFLSDQPKGKELLEKATALESTRFLALYELSLIYEEIGDLDSLVKNLEQLAGLMNRDESLALVYLKLAEIKEQLADEEGAVHYYQQVIRINFNNLPARYSLGRLLAKHREWEKLVQLYLKEAEQVADDSHKLVIYYKIGEIYEDKLNNPYQAIEFYEKAMKIDPSYLPSLKSIAKLYQQQGRWQDLIDLFEAEIESSQDLGHQKFLLEKIGVLYEDQMKDLVRAVEIYERLLKKDQDDLPSIRTLGRLYAKLGHWEDLITVNTREIVAINDKNQIISLLYKNGEIYEEKLHNQDSAIYWYEKVLENNPSYLPALQALGRIYSINNDWPRIIESLQKQVATLKDPLQIQSMIHKMAQIAEEKLGDHAAAIGHYEEILKLNHNDITALRAMEKIFRQTEDISGLLQTLDQETEILKDTQQQAVIFFRMALIFEFKLKDQKSAFTLYQRALPQAGLTFPCLQAIARICCQKKDISSLEETYQKMLKVKNISKPRRSRILFALALLLIKRDGADKEKGMKLLDQLSLELPENYLVQDFIARLQAGQQDWSGVVVQLQKLHENAANQDEMELYTLMRAFLKEWWQEDYFEAANLYIDYFQNWESQKHFTLESLLRYFQNQPNHPGVLAVLQEIGFLCRSEDEFWQVNFLAGQLSAAYGTDIDQAIHGLRESLCAGEPALAALDTLRRVHFREGNIENYLEVAAEESLLLKNSKSKMILMKERAKLYSKMGQTEVAIRIYREILEVEPGDGEALNDLEELLYNQGQWEVLLKLYQEQLEATEAKGKKIGLMLRMGELLHNQLADVEQAEKTFQEILQIDEEHIPTLKMLSHLYLQKEAWEKAQQVWEKVLLIDKEPEMDKEIHSLANYQLGIIYLQGYNQQQKALEQFDLVLELDQHHLPALEEKARLLCQEQEWNAAIQVFEQMVEICQEAEFRIQYNLQLAAIYQNIFSDSQKASHYYQRILDDDPVHQTALDKIGQFFLDTGQPEKALKLVDKEMEAVGEDMARQNQIRIKRAQILSDYTDQRDKAEAELKKIFAQNFLDINAYHGAFQIYRDAGDLDRSFLFGRLIDFFNQTTPSEAEFLDQYPNKVGQSSNTFIGKSSMNHIVVHSGEQNWLRETFLAVGDELAKLFTVSLKSYNLSRNEKISSSDHPLRETCDNFIRVMGIDKKVDIYVASRSPVLIRLLNTSPPAILARQTFLKYPLAKQKFLLARQLYFVLAQNQVLSSLKSGHLADFIEALKITGAAGLEIAESPAFIQEMAQKIDKVLSSKNRKLLSGVLFRNQKELNQVTAIDYYRAAINTANRIAMIFCDDIAVSLDMMIELHKISLEQTDDFAEIAEKLSPCQELMEMVQFYLSSKYAHLRQDLGLSVGTSA